MKALGPGQTSVCMTWNLHSTKTGERESDTQLEVDQTELVSGSCTFSVNHNTAPASLRLRQRKGRVRVRREASPCSLDTPGTSQPHACWRRHASSIINSQTQVEDVEGNYNEALIRSDSSDWCQYGDG